MGLLSHATSGSDRMRWSEYRNRQVGENRNFLAWYNMPCVHSFVPIIGLALTRAYSAVFASQAIANADRGATISCGRTLMPNLAVTGERGV